MKVQYKKIVYLIPLFMGIIIGCNNVDNKKTNENEPKEPVLKVERMDKTVNPADDFYKYTCGTWLKNSKIPEQYSSYFNFSIIAEENYVKLKILIDETIKSKDSTNSAKQKVATFYTLGMDTVKIENDGITPIKEELLKIDDLKTKKDVQNEIAYLHTFEITPLFAVGSAQNAKNSEMVIVNLVQDGLGLPDRDYYTEIPENKEIKEAYVNHMTKMFELIGEDKQKSSNDANLVMKLETRLAKASMTLLERRDPQKTNNEYDLKGIQKLSPNFDWQNYFNNIGLPKPGAINVRQVEYMKEVSKVIKDVDMDTWKSYLKWNFIRNTAAYLNSALVEERFNFYGRNLSDIKKMTERWKRILNHTNSSLGDVVGQLYVEKYFPPEAKKRMVELVINLKAALKESISKLDWMSEETKKQAYEKLDYMKLKIGYPDKWKDYSKLEIKNDYYVLNVLRANKFEFEKDIEKVNKPVDRTEWALTPQTVNAYYSSTMNEIAFPAAILQPPYFDLNADDAANYGSIGMVIGHEMTHGFDDKGRQYDKNGNLKDWWTKQDAENYVKKVSPLIDQFNSYKILDSLRVNGKLTLGENISDLGGITISLMAFKNTLKDKKQENIDGFTPIQRFFIAYGQTWKEIIRDKELARNLKEDVHSPNEARVNGVVYNVPDFYTAFDIKSGKLFRPESERVKVW